MSAAEITVALAEEPAPPALEEIGVYADDAAAFERGLVVLALGRPYWTESMGTARRLLVEPAIADRAREQLAKFERERLHWPPPPLVDATTFPTDPLTPLAWAAAVLGLFQLQAAHPAWVEVGVLDAQAVVERGEWWRVLSALWLHGSGAHVVANALGGALLFTAVLKTFGRARGWWLITAAALVANAGAAWLAYPSAYRSLGASTGIFAGLGLLTGRAARVALRSDHPERRRAGFVALGSGLIVLALYGAGGGGPERVDLGAHLLGFAAGVLIGAAVARRDFSAR